LKERHGKKIWSVVGVDRVRDMAIKSDSIISYYDYDRSKLEREMVLYKVLIRTVKKWGSVREN
jgi:hypothetical protein